VNKTDATRLEPCRGMGNAGVGIKKLERKGNPGVTETEVREAERVDAASREWKLNGDFDATRGTYFGFCSYI
jgi:hypothetical protein